LEIEKRHNYAVQNVQNGQLESVWDMESVCEKQNHGNGSDLYHRVYCWNILIIIHNNIGCYAIFQLHTEVLVRKITGFI